VNGIVNGPGSVGGLRNLFYGQVSLDEWPDQGSSSLEEPQRSFDRARSLILSGDPGQALNVWFNIAFTNGLSSRHTLQAWHFIRHAGASPPAKIAKAVIGAVAEVPMHQSHDLLVAYEDGTASYVNYTGRTMTCEDVSVARMQDAVHHWLAVAQAMASSIGPWDKPSLPPLPAGHARVAALTASGPHFGQGPGAELSANPTAGAFLGAATHVMRLMVDNAIS
jgi:hypothetical protein